MFSKWIITSIAFTNIELKAGDELYCVISGKKFKNVFRILILLQYVRIEVHVSPWNEMETEELFVC
jgi:hypothetical protein